MRQRVGAQHLSSPITHEQVDSALQQAQRKVDELSRIPPTWLSFSNEKLMLAAESMEFLLRQRLRLHQRGYPSSEIDYLKLIEGQINQLKQVYLAFYRFAPGLIHQQKAEQPEIYAWLMLQPELGSEQDNLLCGLSTLDELDTTKAMLIMTQSPLDQLDLVLAELIEGQAKSAKLYFEGLRVRQTLTVALLRRWHKADILKPQVVFPALALQDIEEGIEWLNEHAKDDDYLFERLMTKRDRGTWFRQYFGIKAQDLPSAKALSYAKLLELKEFEAFDIHSKLAPVDFALSGDWKLTPQIFNHLKTLDESEGEAWIQALYLVYGERLPLNGQQVGVDYEWPEVIELLRQWVADEEYVQNLPSRLGYALNFETTLAAMQDANVEASLREWLWRQLCIQARAYIPWDMAMPAHQQDWNFNKFKSVPSAKERFDLRNHNAVVGH